ncbi:unnamed protein product [Rotaria sp. Silwood2]|nr:unnamed protein product [Rotaria sp. Silwood2]
MPKLSKRRSHARSINRGMLRLLDKDVRREVESSTDSDEEEMRLNDDLTDTSLNFNDKVTLNDISDIFELCQNKCNLKFISVLLYMTLRHFDITWRDCDLFLKEVSALTSKTCHKWIEIFTSGDFNQFCTDNRGGKRGEEFYDTFPEIELAAKSFSIERCANKSADFTAMDLAIFVDQKYHELTNTIKDSNSNLIRSKKSCRLDLRRWGACFELNSKRPYFQGHERTDVVYDRQIFVKYFLDHKDQYYTISDGENPLWKNPTKNPPSILIFHDESTFRSGEVSAKRWLFADQAPFFSKGRGRSVMISDYLVMHPSGPFFTLDNREYNRALQEFPELANDNDINYIEKSATGFIDVGYDTYFDNFTILAQFERLFKLIQFKESFKNHKIEIIVDNARTHTAKAYFLLDFGKSIGTRCPIDKIEYFDQQGVKRIVDCFFKTGPYKGLSKGLIEISKDLNVKLPLTLKLQQLRNILSHHPAFKIVRSIE